ncbi:glycosyltransferase family 2 protein [Deferrisoma sp.]
MRLVVIIPCLNEAATVGEVVRRIPRTIPRVGEVVPLVVDDGSTDETARVAREAGALVVSHPFRRGVGAAFQTGLREALRLRADIVANMDGDGQFHPEDLPTLLAPILEGRADMATASRFRDPALVPRMPWIKKWGNRMIARLLSGLIGRRFYDVSCGFRAYNRQAALHLNPVGRYTYTHEVFLDLAFKGFRIVEVPLRVEGERKFGKSRVAGSLWRYGTNAFGIIFRSYRDFQPLRFFGGLALCFYLPAAALLAFFFGHYLLTGRFSGHLWAGFTGGALGFVGFGLTVVAIVADMLDRIRQNQDRILYELKAQRYTQGPDELPERLRRNGQG